MKNRTCRIKRIVKNTILNSKNIWTLLNYRYVEWCLISEFPPSIPCKIAGYIPERVADLFTATEQRHLSEGVMYALTAAEEALTDAKWKPSTQEQLERTGTGTTEQSSVKPKCRDNTECVMKVAYCKI